MRDAVVVGGGPAGLAAAYRLQKHGRSVLLLERSSMLGGLAAGFRRGPYVLDFGPHRLHEETDPEVLDDLRLFLGEELVSRPRRGVIHLRGRRLPYPVGPRTLLGLGAADCFRYGAGAVVAKVGRGPGSGGSYRDAVVGRVGRPLYERFYEPYAKKVWGLSGVRIAADQADKRVNQRGIADLARLALGRAPRFYFYPRGGFGRIPAAYAEALAGSQSVDAVCSASIESVCWDEKGIRLVSYTGPNGGSHERVHNLVWTAPLPELIRRLRPAPLDQVCRSAESLRYRALVVLYVELSVPSVGEADTYYFPEGEFPFNRVMEQKNFSEALVPSDRTVLCMDISCDPDDAVFTAADAELAQMAIPGLERAGLACRRDVAEVFSCRFRNAYPVYELGYRPALDAVFEWLERLPNLWLTGRQGQFLHNNTHHSLLMGYRAADAIHEGGDRSTWAAMQQDFQAFHVAD